MIPASFMLNTIEKAEAIVRNYPQLSYQVGDFKIRVEAPTENGFSVELIVKSEDFEVIYAVGHARFPLYFDIHPSDDYTIEAIKLLQEASALQHFVLGLSDQCRLKLVSYGGSKPWEFIQERSGENWKTTGRAGPLLFPFWKKKRTSYFQNGVINDLIDFGRECDTVYWENIAARLDRRNRRRK